MPTNPEKQQIEVKDNMKELKTQPDISIQQIVEKMIGTKEQAEAEFFVSEGEYNTLLTEVEWRKICLRKKNLSDLLI